MVLAEGTRIVEALALGWELHRLAFLAGRENDPQVRRLLAALAASNGRALPMTEPLLGRISRKDNPQMLLGAFGQRWDRLQSVKATGGALWVALDRVRDPGNLGTVMRTADAVGAAGIVLIGDCTDPYSVEAVRRRWARCSMYALSDAVRWNLYVLPMSGRVGFGHGLPRPLTIAPLIIKLPHSLDG